MELEWASWIRTTMDLNACQHGAENNLGGLDRRQSSGLGRGSSRGQNSSQQREVVKGWLEEVLKSADALPLQPKDGQRRTPT